jgi:hypothetical protein
MSNDDTNTGYDYSEHSIQDDASSLTDKLVPLVDKQQELEQKVDEITELLSDVKKELSRVSEQDIPSLLGGLDSVVKLKDGRKVTVKEKIRCYALKEDKPEAYQWLLDNDGEDIVNQVVVVTIPSGTIGGLEEVLKLLDKSEMVLDVSNVLSVQWQQLDKFGANSLEKGEELPDLFKISQVSSTKIT